MNRLKEARPGIILTCLVIGIAIFAIYSSNEGKSNTKVLSVGQVSKSVTGAKAEEQRKRFMVTTEDQYTASEQYAASRGEYDRLAEAKPAAPTVLTEEKPSAPAPTSKAEVPVAPAARKATAAPANPEPAPVRAAAEPKSQIDGDVDVLARLIMAEAQGEPYAAKVAVGAVVLNRVQSGQWASTIKGVIYQKSGGYFQFTPVENGWINKPADAECIKAAKAALGGADPTNGAQFYYDDSVTNEWIQAKPVSTKIGSMIYAY